ncbi:MAG: ABC transporter permease, partial [Firmicutes bacterium]|nr:ABC transporter permease [Bacillota bacterium]
MNIMNRLTWKSMWENKTRTIVTVIGIVLSAAMFTAVTTLGFSFWSFLVENEVYNSGDYFLRYDYVTREYLDELEKDDRISRMGELDILGYHIVHLEEDNGRTATNTVAVAAGDDAFFDMVTVILEEGRLPQTSDELVINRNTYHFLQQSGTRCEVGDTVTLEVIPEHNRGIPDDVTIPEEGEAFTKAYTVVGIADLFTRLGDHKLSVDHLLTYADEKVEDALWHRAYVKTFFPLDAY